MRDIWTIMKKELTSVVKSKQLLFQIFILPLILILSGSILSFTLLDSAMIKEDEFDANGYVINAPEIFATAFEEIGLEVANIEDVENIKTGISDGDYDILIVFPDDFELTYDQEALSNIEMWYNSSNTDSAYAQQFVMGVLDSVRPNVFTINIDNPEAYDLVSDADAFIMTFEMFFPMYAIMGVFCAVLAIAAESIVGDKERGFMNLLLIAPVKRTNIAFGKALTLFIVNIFSSISVLIGAVISVLVYQKLDFGGVVNYNVGTYISIFLCVLFASFTMTSLCLIFSTKAKTVRQANSACSLILTGVTLINFISSLPNCKEVLENAGRAIYLIPIFNLNLCMQDTIHSSLSTFNLIISVVINLVVAVTITLCTAKMFNNEKVMQD